MGMGTPTVFVLKASHPENEWLPSSLKMAPVIYGEKKKPIGVCLAFNLHPIITAVLSMDLPKCCIKSYLFYGVNLCVDMETETVKLSIPVLILRLKFIKSKYKY